MIHRRTSPLLLGAAGAAALGAKVAAARLPFLDGMGFLYEAFDDDAPRASALLAITRWPIAGWLSALQKPSWPGQARP